MKLCHWITIPTFMCAKSSWGKATFLCVLILLPLTDSHIFSHSGVRSVSGPEQDSFVDRLFEEYGRNKSMNLKQFESLLKELKIGKPQATEEDKSNGIVEENGVTNGHSQVRNIYIS